jgi:hypothetical protein
MMHPRGREPMKERHEEKKEGKKAYEKPVLTRHGKLAGVVAGTIK